MASSDTEWEFEVTLKTGGYECHVSTENQIFSCFEFQKL